MVLQNQDTWSPQGNGYPPLQPSGPPPPNIALPPPPSDAPPPPSYPPQHEDGEEQVRKILFTVSLVYHYISQSFMYFNSMLSYIN